MGSPPFSNDQSVDRVTVLGQPPFLAGRGPDLRNGIAGGPDLDSAGQGGEIARREDHVRARG